MIRKALVFVHSRLFCAGRDTRRGDLIIDAPPNIFGPGLATVRPPSVSVASGFGQQLPMHIDKTDFIEHLREPRALFRQEAGIFSIAFPVFEVNFFVGDIPVAAQNDFSTTGTK
jgi:hypothetical protein